MYINQAINVIFKMRTIKISALLERKLKAGESETILEVYKFGNGSKWFSEKTLNLQGNFITQSFNYRIQAELVCLGEFGYR